MSRLCRVLASFGAIAATLALLPPSSQAVAPADEAAAAGAVAWIASRQQPDGGFEVAMFPGFETRDASLAIAEAVQTGATWSTAQARAALGALEYGGAGGPTPLDALDAYAASITSAGAAAKTIVLSALPLGLAADAFDAAGDGSPVDLVALLDGGCDLLVFTDVLYGMLAGETLCGTTPADAADAVRAAQQADGGWNYNGDPGETGFDPDLTGLALQALVAVGVDADDPAVRAGLRIAAIEQQAGGGWIDFFGTDPNASSSSIIVLGIEAAGFDATSSCWRDTVAPELAATAYADPIAWLRAQQDPDGHFVSPYDDFGVNTLTTSQTAHALLLDWFPAPRAAARTCSAPVMPVVPGDGAASSPTAVPAALTVAPAVPRMTRVSRLVVAVVVLIAATGAAVVRGQEPARATTTAIVVIDDGDTVRSVEVEVGGGTSGLAALQQAANVTVVGFGGIGAAVCAIDGVGNDPGSCLIGPGGKYWAYFRAPAGADVWAYSPAGAAATTVRGGDVEGWRYGTGAAPRSSAAYCDHVGCAPPPTSPPAAEEPAGGDASTGGTGAAASTGGGAPAGTVATDATGTRVPPAPDPGDAEADGAAAAARSGEGAAATTRPSQRRAGRLDDARSAAALAAGGGDGGGRGSPIGVVVAAATLVVAAGAAVWLRRRRARVAPGSSP